MADEASAGHATEGTARPPAAAIDIEALADRVYRLMLAEIRLTRARLGNPPGRAGER